VLQQGLGRRCRLDTFTSVSSLIVSIDPELRVFICSAGIMVPWKNLHARLQDLRHPNCPPWYLSVFPCLAALNQVEDIAALYPIVLQEIDETEHLDVTRKIREALTKSVGIIGAAKVSIFYNCGSTSNRKSD